MVWRPLRILAVFGLVALLVGVLAVGSPRSEVGMNPARRGTYTTQQQPPPEAQVVRIGFYPVAVYNLDQASNTFYADTYVWLKWKGQIDPTTTLEFTNMVEEWGKQLEPLRPEPITLKDGSRYQSFKVEGRFVQPFSLAEFPLDRHDLRIMVEDTVHPLTEIAYVIDRENSGISGDLMIPGWHLQGWQGAELQHDYGTNFGEDQSSTVFTVANFSMGIYRPTSFFLMKLLLPLFIVVLAALAALLVPASSLDARLAMPLGALLSAIFLQKSYSDGLPDLGYLVFMDKIYLLAYPLILIVLIRAIAGYLRLERQGEGVLVAVHRDDTVLLAWLTGLFVGGTLLITLLR
ncbi:MAG: hypothetical protein ACKOZW_00670 [Cyanobium sp.]